MSGWGDLKPYDQGSFEKSWVLVLPILFNFYPFLYRLIGMYVCNEIIEITFFRSSIFH